MDRVRVKLCGMTRREDIEHAIHIGVDAIGLIFYNQSPRAVQLNQAESLLSHLPPFVTTVAVLVDAEPAFVKELIRLLPIQLLQFHGQETAEFCEQFAMPYIKTIQPESAIHSQEMMRKFKSASALLFDTPSSDLKGGTGQVFDWTLIPKEQAKPIILAGGLNVDNVHSAIKTCNPYAIDLCSGVETSKGVKDHQKMNELMKAVWSKANE